MTDFRNQRDGGFVSSPDNVKERIFFRATPRRTKTVTVLSGQVLKAHSFVETNGAGKAVAHSGFSESATVKFVDIAAASTIIIAGLTFTAGGSGTTAAQLATSWADIPSGTGYAAVTSAVGGTFTAGTLTGYFTESTDEADTVRFNSATALVNATDVAVTGTGAAPTVVITGGTTAKDPIAGVTLFDVDASGGDTKAEVYLEASFWDSALVWSVNPAVDTITKADGTTVACTTYNTGCDGDSAEAVLLKQKFVEGTKFDNLGFLSIGETA